VNLEAAEDADLARRVGAGGPDGAAESELCRRFERRIRLYGLRHLRDEQTARDLVQQVLLILIESLRKGRVREPDRLASFVLGTCRMVARDLRRGEQRVERLHKEFASVTEPPQDPPLPFDLSRLQACFEGLRPRERIVLAMTFFAERSSDEIAAELGMATGHVRVVRHRAVGHLQRCLGVDGPEVPA
jgi:RNA polymerase sigma-70 factor, ECF subfamily